MDQFVLFGDSIVQQSFSQTHHFAFGAALADAYARKLDVVNRGLSGYNTTQALRALPLCLPEPEQSTVRFLLIFFGANDARIPGTPGGPDQSVPLAEFKRNVRAMVQHPAVQAQKGMRIILVTTPPVDERMCMKSDQDKYPALGRVLRRTAACTATYAQAIRSLGEELEVPVLDIWTAMVSRAGATGHGMSDAVDTPVPGSLALHTNEALQGFLHDGLHFSGEGYRVLYGELMALIERTWPDQMPGSLKMKLPAWDEPGAWRPNENSWDVGKSGGENGSEGGGGGGDGGAGGTVLASGTFEAVVEDVQKLT